MSIRARLQELPVMDRLSDVKRQLKLAYPDDMRARFRAANLFYICMAAVGLVGLLLVVFMLGGYGYLETHARIVFGGLFVFIIATFLGCIRLVLKGRLQMARFIVVFLSVGAVFLAITLTGGFPKSVASPAIMISVVMCYCLYGWRGSLKTTVAMVAAFLGQWALIEAGWFDPPNFVSTTSYEFNFVAVILATLAVTCTVLAIFDISNHVFIKQANASSVSKTNFLANTSHEIRTPMNGIIGMSEVMMRTTNLDADQKMYMTAIHQSGTALMTIINDILDYSRLDAGRVEIQKSAFNLYTLIHEIRTLLTINAAEKNIILKLGYGENLPQRFVGDAARIRQVIINLMANAIKFTEGGEVSLNVSMDPAAAGPNVRIEIVDTGIGIPTDKLSSIFERFTQAESGATQKHGGTGLGLSISEKLVALMGGEIGVVSEQGVGSTFWFTLNLDQADALEGESQSSAMPDSNVHSFDSPSAARVLLLSADPVLVERYGSVLYDRGYRVFHTAMPSQLEQWLKTLNADGPVQDLILVDETLDPDLLRRNREVVELTGLKIPALSIGPDGPKPEILAASISGDCALSASNL